MQYFKPSIYNVFIEQDKEYTTIFNSFSGGIIKLENEIYTVLKNGLFTKNQINYFDELIKGGYIVLKDIDEYRRVYILHENYNMNPNPTTVSYVLVPTLNCNLRCVYCFQKNYTRNKSGEIFSKGAMTSIIDFIVQENQGNTNLRNIKINWFGGEPLLCFESIILFYEQLSDRLSEKNISIKTGITTNGVLLNEERLILLKNKCNLEKIQITVDGEEKTYCTKKQTTTDIFNKVLENIYLSSKYVRTVVRLNADKSNFDELKRLALLIKHKAGKENLILHFAQLRNYTNDENVNNVYFNDYEYWVAKKEFYQTLKNSGQDQKNLTRKLPSFSFNSFCGLVAKQNYVIDYKGNLFKCEHQIGDEKYCVGNIKYGLFYNNIYQNAVKLSNDVKCKQCNLFPCCNYAQCNIMHNFAGKKKCMIYENQLLVLQSKVKEYLQNLQTEGHHGN